ncbi:MAG: MBL fold metallo-hydrolase [Mariprofundales bacterium]
MKFQCLNETGNIDADLSLPTTLFEPRSASQPNHAIYWIGLMEDSAFRCNSYLLIDGERAILIDPGSRANFAQAVSRVAQIMSPMKVTDLLICHQDPDVGASMVDWLDLNPELRIITSPRTQVLLPYFGKRNYTWINSEEPPETVLASGSKLQYINAPFLHSPAAFTTFDHTSGFLFSGDIWAAISSDWQLLVHDFDTHRANMDKFHLHYMACNRACRGFTAKLQDLEINAILPQHGSILDRCFVPQAIDYLNQLQCGLDLEYPEA